MNEVVKCVVNSNTSWIEVANITIATINVLAVIAFFIYEKKKLKKDKVNEYKLSWYKLIDIPKRVDSLNEFVVDAKARLEKLKNSDVDNLNKRKEISQKLITDFDKKIISEKNIITPILKCVSDESNREITKLFNDLMELHDNQLINAAILSNGIIDYSNFIDLKNSIVEKYYKIGEIFLN